jgi:hypothetical protein
MQPLAVDLRILRALLGAELRVAPGRVMMARVVAAEGGRGSLSIAGMLIDAELPKNVRAGEDLRLVVKEVSADRVLLSLTDPAASAVPPPLAQLPGGGSVRVSEREASASARTSPDTHTLALRYDAPALGAVDLRFELDSGSLRVGVSLAPGDPLAAGMAGAEELRAALADALPRTVSVTVTPRREPLDLYA